MDLRQLRYFEAVARHRHFTHAARELHLAQSALSQQVARLEQELGTPLLDRTTRSVEPTVAGELVAARARVILAEAAALRDEVDALNGLARGRVRIGALLFGGRLDIPAILAGFTESHPQIEVGLREGTAQRMLEMLREGSLDLSFALQPLHPPTDLDGVTLSSEELVVVGAAGHRLLDGQRRRLTAQDLRDDPLIMFEPGASTRERVDEVFAAAGMTPRIALEANDMALVRALVARGIGLAIMPKSFAALPGPAIETRPLHPTLRLPVVLWWRRGHSLSPAARAFVDYAGAHARATSRRSGTA
jgi:LysR family transcriptional regulator, transcription activator of glutamate synthase operon